ncbi:unnamed protein product [Fusarium langsethiae]|nr:unnamed protein product [Fusarium langsethiae]GKU10981.1 unnamed protein product [Fusarium langsethiae]
MKYDDRMALAHLVMVFVGSYIPSILLFLNTLCAVRSSKDPARTAFTYFKFALLVFSAHALFDTATYGFFLFGSLKFSDNYYEPDFDWARYATLIKALGIFVRAFQAISKLSDVVADILITIILLRLSTATLTIFSGNATGKKLRLVSYGAAFVLSALAFIVFGLQIRYIYEISENDVEIGLDCYLKSVQIEFAVRVLLFVICLGVLVRAVMVKKQVKADKNLTWASAMLLAASVVWLLHTSFAMASLAAWENLSNAWNMAPVDYEFYFYIFEVIFGIWPQFAVLVLVYFIGLAKANGIWSRDQESLTHVEEGK